jgi:hypothetical protein
MAASDRAIAASKSASIIVVMVEITRALLSQAGGGGQ